MTDGLLSCFFFSFRVITGWRYVYEKPAAAERADGLEVGIYGGLRRVNVSITWISIDTYGNAN